MSSWDQFTVLTVLPFFQCFRQEQKNSGLGHPHSQHPVLFDHSMVAGTRWADEVQSTHFIQNGSGRENIQ